MTSILRIAAFTAALALGACVSLAPTIYPVSPPAADGPVSLKGILTSGTADTKPLRFLIIHGMGANDSTDNKNYCAFASLIGNLARSLGAGPQVIPTKIRIRCSNGLAVPEPTPVPVPGSSVPAQFITFDFPSSAIHRGVYFSFLYWAPLTKPFEPLLDERLHPQWAWLTTQEKAFIRTRLSDVVLYGGKYRRTMRAAVEKALCLFVGGTPNYDGHICNDPKYDDQTILVTHSLGGYMLADAIEDLADFHQNDKLSGNAVPETNAAARALESTSLIYMLANQLALLDLSTARHTPDWHSSQTDDAVTGSDGNSDRALYSMIRRWKRTRDAAGKPEIGQMIGFSDPDDLLTYMISADEMQLADLPKAPVVANVYLGVTPTWLEIAADPTAAHMNYLTDPRVVQIMVCGMTGNSINPCSP